MKSIRMLPIGFFTLLLLSTAHTIAVVDQRLTIQGTNLVLSWPSPGGYQQYMIQYRQTLDPSTPWTVLTNNYFANSTNRTTYTIIGVVPLPPSGGGGGGGGSTNPPPSPMSASLAEPTEPMAARVDGTGSIVPLALYPPGFDLSNFRIYDPLVSDWVSGATYDRPTPLLSRDGPLDGPGDDPDPGVTSGFYRVWHIPDWSFNVTNYTYDGPTFFPVDFADYLDRVADIQVLLDGQPIPDAVFMPYVFTPGETNWGMGIYFDLFPSGTHQIQLQTTIRLNDEIGDESVFLTLGNLPRGIVVDNEVTFTNWEDLIQSTNFAFHAQTKNQNTDWWIDIYDAWNNYVNGGSGHTSNGQISWTWNLTDTSGNPRDDIDSDPFFYSYITFATAAGPQTTRSTPAAQTAYPATGYWLFTYLDRHYLDVKPGTFPNVQTYYTTAMTGLAGGPSFRGIPNSTYPIKFGTNVYTQQQRNDSWSEVKARLYDARNRNFYYHGHGNANTIGCDMHTFDTNNNITGGTFLPGSKAYISSQNISNEITFNRYGGSRPYRFVWLDGCSTANGNWPGAFGVDKSPYDLDHYTNSVSNAKHRRPSAFVGWNQSVGTGGVWGNAQNAYNFRSEWMTKWYYSWQTEGLWQAFKDARQSANWPPGGDSQLFGALKVYGYTNLLMNGYNQKNDWRWP